MPADPPSETPIEVAIAVVEDHGRFLVGLRPEGAPLAGFAEFPGGKVIPGESPQAAAVRECREESGLHVEIFGEYIAKTHRYDHGLLHIHFFRCQLVNDTPQSLEPRSPFRWVDAAELATLQFPAANAHLMQLLLGKLRTNSHANR